MEQELPDIREWMEEYDGTKAFVDEKLL